jgi:hypothetical protein
MWRDGALVYVNNVAANSLYGMSLGGIQYDTHGNVDTQVLDNILINNESFGISLHYAEGHTSNLTVDHNLYFNNGWRSWDDGGIWHAGAMVVRTGDPGSPSWDPYITLAEVQAATPWEEHGVEGDPHLWDYNPSDHDLHDGSWPDFHLTSASTLAIDGGVTALPASLVALLEKFKVDEGGRQTAADADFDPAQRTGYALSSYPWGAAYDIGRYEAGFRLLVTPAAPRIQPGGTAVYTLSLYPSDVPFSVQLSLPGPTPHLTATLHTATLSPGAPVTLTVQHDGSPGTQVYHLTIAGEGAGFEDSLTVELLVGGEVVYLPVIRRP